MANETLIGSLRIRAKIQDEANEILTKLNTELNTQVDKLLESQVAIEYTNRKLVENLVDAKAEVKQLEEDIMSKRQVIARLSQNLERVEYC